MNLSLIRGKYMFSLLIVPNFKIISIFNSKICCTSKCPVCEMKCLRLITDDTRESDVFRTGSKRLVFMGGRGVRGLSPSNGMPIPSQWSSGRYNIVCSLTIALFEVVSTSISQQSSGSFVQNSMLIDTGPFPLATRSSGGLKVSEQAGTL